MYGNSGNFAMYSVDVKTTGRVGVASSFSIPTFTGIAMGPHARKTCFIFKLDFWSWETWPSGSGGGMLIF